MRILQLKLLQVVEKLYRLQWSQLDGLGALVISPTRELALQIFNELRKIGKRHEFSAGLMIGGKNLKDEQERVGGGLPNLDSNQYSTEGFGRYHSALQILTEVTPPCRSDSMQFLPCLVKLMPGTRVTFSNHSKTASLLPFAEPN